jgi:FG-GAP-like repeat
MRRGVEEMTWMGCRVLLIVALLGVAAGTLRGDDWQRVAYNNPGLVVDLGVGLWAWPMPMDYDGDGDYDLVVSCDDVPYNGTYFFENPGGDDAMPVFKPGVRIGPGVGNVQVSYVDGEPRVLSPNTEYASFLTSRYSAPRTLSLPDNIHTNKMRANQWKYVDYDDDGRLDLIIGVGDWTDYGWDNAFNDEGEWTRGPLHGYVYLLRNTGTSEEPRYADPIKLTAGGDPIDVYGMPSPNLADFDGDGDLDLLCGEFVDRFTYFENVGTRAEPRFQQGRYLMLGDEPLRVDACMFVPVAIDWDRDGDIDIVAGQEDGRVMLIENSGRLAEGLPQFAAPRFFQQEADAVKFGVLVTPASYDWDGDGDEDLICGNASGRIGFIENLGGNPPRWAAPVRLKADGEVIRIQAGANGSIQGPGEAKWGYTAPSVADWDHDGLQDLLVNSIWGKVIWYRNVGSRQSPELAAAQPVRVMWASKPRWPKWNWWSPKAGELVTQWRTTPVAIDWNRDGLCDLVMLDDEGYLAFYERQRQDGELSLLPPVRIFITQGPGGFDQRHQVKDQRRGALRLNTGLAGRSGRRKLGVADLNGDGLLDFIVNSLNVNVLIQEPTADGGVVLRDLGSVHDHKLAGHTTSPTTVDFDGDGVRELLVGAEDGFFYHHANPLTAGHIQSDQADTP